MKRMYTLFTALTATVLVAVAQPQLTLDSTQFRLGNIEESGEALRLKIPFRNTGNEPLIIARAGTSDGGSYAQHPNNPIFPGKTDTIIFVYDRKRIGPFTKTVQINTGHGENQVCTIKGCVVRQPTTARLLADTIFLGDIPYGDTACARFELVNTGNEPLYPMLNLSQYPEHDLLFHSGPNNQMGIPTGEKADFSLTFINLHGNVGDFERRFRLLANIPDTAVVVIRGRYTGRPPTDKIIHHAGYSTTIFEYSPNGQLMRTYEYSNNGERSAERTFIGPYCTYKRRYATSYMPAAEEHYLPSPIW